MNDTKLIEIACELRHETGKAFLIFDGTREAWLSKSLTEEQLDGRGKLVGVIIPEWLAKQKELI